MVILRDNKMTNVAIPSHSFNCILVGDRSVGKTSYINQLLSGLFVDKYEPTEKTISHHFSVNTNEGCITFNIWDCVSHRQYWDLKSFHKIDCAIILFDGYYQTSCDSVSIWHQLLRQSNPTIPITICQNHFMSKGYHRSSVDILETISTHDINLTTYDLCVQNGNNINEPFTYIIQKLMGNNVTISFPYRIHTPIFVDTSPNEDNKHTNIEFNTDNKHDNTDSKMRIKNLYNQTAQLLHQLSKIEVNETHQSIIRQLIQNHSLIKDEWNILSKQT
jgi:GTPase SAR1 family protein